MRWSCGANGLVPRRAQRRVILFFWPILASSANQTSTPSGPTPAVRPIASRRAGRLLWDGPPLTSRRYSGDGSLEGEDR